MSSLFDCCICYKGIFKQTPPIQVKPTTPTTGPTQSPSTVASSIHNTVTKIELLAPAISANATGQARSLMNPNAAVIIHPEDCMGYGEAYIKAAAAKALSRDYSAKERAKASDERRASEERSAAEHRAAVLHQKNWAFRSRSTAAANNLTVISLPGAVSSNPPAAPSVNTSVPVLLTLSPPATTLLPSVTHTLSTTLT